MIPIRYNIGSLAVRKTTTIAAALGIALVVFVLSSSMMLSEGIKRTMGNSGRSDYAIVLRKGSDAELGSTIDQPTVGLILSSPGVKKDEQGRPMGVAEVVIVIAQDKLGTDGVSNVQVRGVPENALAFRPEMKIIEGRAASPGTDEVIIGKRIEGRFKGMELGQSFELRKNRMVKVVGVFEAGGSSMESEVWADVDTIRSSFGREGIVSSVTARLDSKGVFEGFEAAVEQDKRLGLEALRESEYYEKQSENLAMFVTAMGTVISILFAIGVAIGAMITMYTSIANRRREIGTLRALGFSKGTILFSFLGESVLLALAGGIVGAVASLAMGFVEFSTMNFTSWSEIVFKFTPTAETLLSALLFAVFIGVIGGFFPAVRAARVSPIQAMRG